MAAELLDGPALQLHFMVSSEYMGVFASVYQGADRAAVYAEAYCGFCVRFP